MKPCSHGRGNLMYCEQCSREEMRRIFPDNVLIAQDGSIPIDPANNVGGAGGIAPEYYATMDKIRSLAAELATMKKQRDEARAEVENLKEAMLLDSLNREELEADVRRLTGVISTIKMLATRFTANNG